MDHSLQEHSPELGDGRYLVTKRIGEGGMAYVYRAWDDRLQKWCAIKMMLPKFGTKRKLRARFEQEAYTMARLEHRHIIRVYDVEKAGKIPYLVMELAEGGCILDWVGTHGPMPERLAIDVMIQLCKGLHAAHDAGIIHRDIKPHNLLVNRRGIVKITDFGIARVDDEEHGNALTRTGSVMGTFAYMAPEQRSNSKGVDHRADIYACGATLYTLVTGETPVDLFVAEQDASVLQIVPASVRKLVATACAYRPEDRHSSAMDLAEACMALRKTLPKPPEHTPPLVLNSAPLPSGPPAQLTALSFPEIAEAFQVAITNPTMDPDATDFAPTQQTMVPEAFDADLHTSNPRPATPQRDAPVIPYTMSRPTQDDGVDRSYLYQDLYQEDPDPAPTPVHEIRLEGAAPVSDHRRPKAPQEVDDDMGVDAMAGTAEDAADALKEFIGTVISVAWKPLTFLMAPLMIISVTLGLMATIGAARVGEAELSAMASHNAYVQAIHAHIDIIGDLEAMGANRTMLDAKITLMDEAAERSRDAQFKAANSFVSQSEQDYTRLIPKLDASVQHKAHSAKGHLEALKLARQTYVDAMIRWEETSDTTMGGLAVSFGMANSP